MAHRARWTWAALGWLGALAVGSAEAGGPPYVVYRPGGLVPTSRPADAAPSPMLGSFYPGPYITVRANFPAGGGYSPLGIYNDQNLTLYGPMSALRAQAAPVRSYARGYDGRVHAVEATGFSYPNRALVGPVVYPTRGTYFYAPGRSGTPPWWNDASTNWIDQD